MYVLQKNYWIFLIAFAFYLIMIPFFTAGLPGDSIFNIEVTHDQLKFRLINEKVLPVVIGGCILIGMLCGVVMFRFLQDKKEATIFLSLGITRIQLFINRLVSGLIMILAGTAIPMVISMALNITALGTYEGMGRNTFYITAGLAVTAFISMAVAAVVSMATGTVTETVIGWGSIMAAPFCVLYCINRLLKTLFWGNAWGAVPYYGTDYIRPGLADYFADWNPCTFFNKDLQIHSQFMRPLSSDVPPPVDIKLLIIWIVILVLIIAISAKLMKKRNAEIAGLSGSSRPLAEWVVMLTSFVVFTMVVTFLYSFNAVLAWISGAVSCPVIHMFWRKTVFVNCTERINLVRSVAAQLAVFAAVCVIVAIGGFNSVDHFLLNGDIDEAEVSYAGEPGGIYEKAEGSSTGRGYYITSMLKFESEDEIAEVIKLQQDFNAAGKREMETDEDDFSETVVPYDVIFSYTDTDGREHTWYYDRASLEQLEKLIALESCETVKKGQKNLFEGRLDESEQINWAQQAYWNGTVYLTDRFCSQTYEIGLSYEQREELLQAVYKDRSSMTADEKYFPAGETRAILMFSGNGEYDCEFYSYNLDNAFVYVTEEYRSVLKWLDDNELTAMIEKEPEIESVTLQKFDPHMGSIDKFDHPLSMYFMSYRSYSLDDFIIQKEFGNKYTITDPQKISELESGLRNGYFMSRGGYLAAVKIKGIEGYIYMFISAENVPDFVKG